MGTSGDVFLVFCCFFFLCEYEQLLASQCYVEGMRARGEGWVDRMYRTSRGVGGHLGGFTSSCRQSSSVRCACRRTAGCCSSWPARPARCSSAWWWGRWRGGQTPARPAPSACGTKAFFNHRLASSWRRRYIMFDTPTNGDVVPSDAPHKLWNVSSAGPTGSLQDLWCV